MRIPVSGSPSPSNNYCVAVWCRIDEAEGITFICVSREDDAYHQTMAEMRETKFDNIVVMVPSPSAVAEAAEYLAPGGVMNIFASLKRGTTASLDLSDVYLRGSRLIEHSGLTSEDMRLTLNQVESGDLSPNWLVAALGSLGAARDGLRAVRDGMFSDKIMIFPHIRDLPLTPLPDLKHRLPSLYAKLKDGHEWTVEAKEELLRLMLA